MIELLSDPQSWLAFLTLSLLEIVLGLDNIIFISILVRRLPDPRQGPARITGLALAMLTRVALLFSIVWLTRLVQPLFQVGDQGVSGRDLILLAGGLFLLGKSVLEIHGTLEGARDVSTRRRVYANFVMTVVQIAVLDIVFSLDSVFTAVGLAKDLPIMVAAIVVAILVMMMVSGSLSLFIEHDQELWSPEFAGPLRVSSLQTGVFAGPVGSAIGHQRVSRGAITWRLIR